MNELEYNSSYEALVWICYGLFEALNEDERDRFSQFLTEKVSEIGEADGLRSQKDNNARLLLSQKLRIFLDGIDTCQD